MIKSLFHKLWQNIYIKNLTYAILILVVLIVSMLIFLRIYTFHGQALSVPDFTGMTLEEVEKATLDKKLNYLVIDSVFISEKLKGTVVDQKPDPNFKVKKHRTIFLTTNAYEPEKILVPQVVDRSLREAIALIETNGLRLGELIYVHDIAKNYVLEQRYNGLPVGPNDTVFKGSQIDLVLGKGLGDKKTPVPNLIELTMEQAKFTISNSFLNLGAKIYDNSVIDFQDSLSAFIWKQKPDPDTDIQIPLGSAVDIWLTLDSLKLPQADTMMLDTPVNDGMDDFFED